jgi:hypothetical protein
MSHAASKPKAYIKEGCPFSFKFLVFMTEAGLLDHIDVVRLREGTPELEATKRRLGEQLGKAASFPAVELEPGRPAIDSDRLIAHFAERHGARPDDLPVLSFYKETIFPKLLEHHQLKKTVGKSSAPS